MTRKNIIARIVLSNNKIVSSRFFEQSQFEQFTMSPILTQYSFPLNKPAPCLNGHVIIFSCTFLENFLIQTRKKSGEIASMEVASGDKVANQWQISTRERVNSKESTNFSSPLPQTPSQLWINWCMHLSAKKNFYWLIKLKH
jgi:hypothetical protein